MAVKTKPKKTMEDAHPGVYQTARNIETMMRENKDSKDTIAELLGMSRTTLWRRLTVNPYEITLLELDILCAYWGIDFATLMRPPFERGIVNG